MIIYVTDITTIPELLLLPTTYTIDEIHAAARDGAIAVRVPAFTHELLLTAYKKVYIGTDSMVLSLVDPLLDTYRCRHNQTTKLYNILDLYVKTRN